jgi:hypothetical protein
VGLAKTIAIESEFRTAMPRHAKAVFAYIEREPALKLHRWAFSRAIARRPDLATVLFVASSGQRTEIWLSVAADGEGGWSVQPVLKSMPTADGESDNAR